MIGLEVVDPSDKRPLQICEQFGGGIVGQSALISTIGMSGNIFRVTPPVVTDQQINRPDNAIEASLAEAIQH